MKLEKIIKARYKNGVIEPVGILDIPDDVEITIIIDTNSFSMKKSKYKDWRRWRGMLKGTSALQEHELEHKEDI